MTQGQSPGIAAAVPFRPLDERQNARAVDLIESAERAAPYCLCGSHMLAVAHAERIWLECARLQAPRSGLGGFVDRLAAIGHTRRMIVELPSRP